MGSIVIKNGRLVNEGQIVEGDLHIKNGRIEQLGTTIDVTGAKEVDAKGHIIMPGIIDDQVHFREPGLTHKGDIGSESRAALAGGVTSFMEMPNTKPAALTQDLLEAKYDIAKRTSFSNYSFFMGASNENLEDVLQTNRQQVCGVKVFMGSSTGNMLVDDREVLEHIFSEVPMLIATHCEDEATIRTNMEQMKALRGDQIEPKHHPEIRSIDGCLISSSLAVRLAKKYDTRLHILHISTAEELVLFSNAVPLADKRITAEVCVHHLYFDADDYATLGNKIKCNPAIKAPRHKKALFEALLDDRLDIIATDHAPHAWIEKDKPYLQSPSGLPLVQHTLQIMLDFYHKGQIGLEKIVDKMCHAPAVCFDVKERGYLREGYWGDVLIVDPDSTSVVTKDSLLYKCGWSPLEGISVRGTVRDVFLNGAHVVQSGVILPTPTGQRLSFDRA